MSLAIRDIDTFNSDLELGIASAILDAPTINDIRKTNDYNKALLQSALDSNQ